MATKRKQKTLRDSGVTLIDCEHKTPPAAPSGYPYIAIPQLKNGRLNLSDARRITQDHFVAWTRKALPKAYDVILSRRCNPGETAFVPPGLECALGQNLVLLRADGTDVYPPFLRWLVRGSEWWEQIGRIQNVGAVFDSLKCADIPNISLPIPSIHEQKRIADILGTLDDKIEMNRRMNETLEAMARRLFKSWFIDFDPVHAKAALHREHPTLSNVDLSRRALPYMAPDIAELFPESFEDSVLGRLPAGWTVKVLENLAEIIMGTSPPGDTYNDVGLGTPLVNGPVEFGEYFTIRRKWTTQPTRLSQLNDLVFCVRGSTTGRRVVADGAYCLGRGVCAMRSRSGEWCFLHKLIDFSLDRMLSRVSGSVFPNLNGPDLKQFLVVAPSSELRNAFQRAVEPLMDRVGRNISESTTQEHLRDTLLPRLLSGDIPVTAEVA